MRIRKIWSGNIAYRMGKLLFPGQAGLASAPLQDVVPATLLVPSSLFAPLQAHK